MQKPLSPSQRLDLHGSMAFLPREESARGPIGFALVVSTIATHLFLPLGSTFLFSEHLWIEIVGTIALIAAPPIGVFLAIGHWTLTRQGFVPLITIVLGGMLTVLTFVALIVGFCMA